MKKKIAVIGGGLGSMSAIYHLMNQPNAKELYEITLYQQSWSLGGKGASGVNRNKGFRVEEHGIHFWFGFYENGFNMMKDVYAKLNRPPLSPLSTFDKAFKPQPTMDFAQIINNQWTQWNVEFPPLPGKVGDGKFENPIEHFIEIGIRYMADEFNSIIHHLSAGCLMAFTKPFQKKQTPPKHPTHEHYLNAFEEKLVHLIEHPFERRLKAMADFYKDPAHHGEEHRAVHGAFINDTKRWLWDMIGHLVSKFPNLLRIWCLIDFGMTVLKGVVEDGVLTVKEGSFVMNFTKINHFDFQDWLIYHGADKHFIFNVPAVKSMYDGPFAFFKGAVSTPNVEAGTALNIFFRLGFTCKEAVMWRMQAGMGDTVFAPIYQYLTREFPNNVHFKFFHKAKNLVLSDDKTQVETLELERLVDLAEGIKTYKPFVQVKGLDCWPSEPLYEQLNPEQVKQILDHKIRIDSDWSGWKGTKIVKKRGEDFDDIIIGASLPAIPHFCADLIKNNPIWANMLDKVGSVQTQAFQIWLTKTPEELGANPQLVLSTYVEPLDTYACMNQILEREDWRMFKEQPKYLLYVCGAFIDSEAIPPANATYFPDNQLQEVFDNMMKYVTHDLQFILPKAFDEQGNFDWNIIFDPTGAVGPERLKYQYYRANIDATERYVFALRNSSKHRLRTDETGYSNVYLTGDWIQNGMNIGFVEGATISGILAAKSLSGNKDIPLFMPW